MVKYNNFDSVDNATVGDFIASFIFRIIISFVFVGLIIFIPAYTIQCLITLFYFVYISFNVIPILKSIKKIYWDNFIRADKNAFSNTVYIRMIFQIFETLISFSAIFILLYSVL